MKFIAAVVSVSLLLAGRAPAASEYDKCVREEKALRSQEKDRCSGLSYLLNPSGCFAAQKALRAHENGRCRETSGAGSVEPPPNPPPVPPLVPAPVPPAPTAAAGKGADKGPEQECDRLKAENARIKAEIDRLRAEIERLGKK